MTCRISRSNLLLSFCNEQWGMAKVIEFFIFLFKPLCHFSIICFLILCLPWSFLSAGGLLLALPSESFCMKIVIGFLVRVCFDWYWSVEVNLQPIIRLGLFVSSEQGLETVGAIIPSDISSRLAVRSCNGRDYTVIVFLVRVIKSEARIHIFLCDFKTFLCRFWRGCDRNTGIGPFQPFSKVITHDDMDVICFSVGRR